MKDLQVQHDFSYTAYTGRKECIQAKKEIAGIKSQIQTLLTVASSDFIPLLKKLEDELNKLENSPRGSKDASFGKFENEFTSLFNIFQENDMPATTQAIQAAVATQKSFAQFRNRWTEMKTKHISELNKRLQASGLSPVKL
jgi:hypothetical protein